MAIKTKLSNEDRDELTKDVNDLDKVYLEKMKEEGIDSNLLEQFKNLSIEIDKERK
jgi:hypothetical protein